LKASVREVDTVARLGGDEFVILLDTIDDPQHVKAVAQKLHDCFQQSMQIGGREMFVHSSIGIGIFPRDGGDADELVHNADQAMYNSKKAGGNTFSF
jgi:diguanylate cyclase (GGDEF)-like protein